MTRIDPAAERQRLAALYSTMSDLELEKIGRNPLELNPWAAGALTTEMKKRGLEWPPPSLAEELKHLHAERNLKVLGKYEDQRAANAGQQRLNAVGIESFLALDPGNAGANDQARMLLLVRGTDYEAASQYLREQEALAAADDAAGQLAEDQLPSKPVVLRAYRDMPAAMVDQTALDAAGIRCFLYDDNLVRLDWFISNAIGGVKLVVAENTAREAAQILASAVPITDEGTTGA
jgi:hypothetical protein